MLSNNRNDQCGKYDKRDFGNIIKNACLSDKEVKVVESKGQ